MDKEKRIQQILEAGLVLAELLGLENVSRRRLAEKIGCSEGLINRYYGDIQGVQAAVKAEATLRNIRLPDNTEAALLGATLRKVKGYGGARRGAGRPAIKP